MTEPRPPATDRAPGKRTPSPHLSGFQPRPSPPQTPDLPTSPPPKWWLFSQTRAERARPETPGAVCGLPEGLRRGWPKFPELSLLAVSAAYTALPHRQPVPLPTASLRPHSSAGQAREAGGRTSGVCSTSSGRSRPRSSQAARTDGASLAHAVSLTWPGSFVGGVQLTGELSWPTGSLGCPSVLQGSRAPAWGQSRTDPIPHSTSLSQV